MPGTFLGPGDIAVKESDTDPCCHGAQILRKCHRESGRYSAKSAACILGYLWYHHSHSSVKEIKMRVI